LGVEVTDPVTSQPTSRPLTPEERAVLVQILRENRFPAAVALAAQLPLVIAAGGTPTVVNLMVEGAVAPADCADGPVPGRAIVESPDGESIGEVLVWVNSGRLSGLEYAWYTEQPPEAMPPAERLRLE
jgi:hypothetical protein